MIEVLINQVDALVLAFVQGAFGSLIPTVQILWRLMFIVFIAVFGYKVIISGRFNAPDLVVNCVKIIILLCIATQWDTFCLLVYDMVTDLPAGLAGQIIQGAASSVPSATASTEATANTALSLFYDRAIEVSTKLLQGAGWNNFGLYFYACLIWLGAILFTGYAAMLIILAKIAVALLLAVAPIFILLLIFANTKSLFEGWLRTLLNYAIIPIFVYALLALLLTLAESPLKAMEENIGPDGAVITYIAPFMFVSFVSVLLLAQIMNIAASITGGLSLSTLGSGMWLMGKASRGSLKTGIIGANAVRHPKKTYGATKQRIGNYIQKVRGF